MPRRKRVSKRRHQLNAMERWELMLGPGSRASRFSSEAEREAAWWRHRDELLADRPELWPWARREYEGPAPAAFEVPRDWSPTDVP